MVKGGVSTPPAKWLRLLIDDNMMSDLISYALLTGVFIVTGLRLFFDKSNKLSERLFFRSRPTRVDEDSEPASVDA